MSNFAKIENSFVIEILVVPDEFSDFGEKYLSEHLGLGGKWIETPRKNNTSAILGGEYSEIEDSFIPPKPQGSGWILNEEYQWIKENSVINVDSFIPPPPLPAPK